MAQSILVNTGIAAAGRVANVALGLVAIKLLTGFLGPSGYGGYALLLSFGTILQLVADSGLYLQLTHSIATEPHRQAEIIRTIFSLRVIFLAIIFLIGLGIAALTPNLRDLKGPYLIMTLGLAAQSISQLYMGIFQYHKVVWRATLGDLTGRLAQIATLIIIGLKSAALGGMVAAFTIGSLITLVSNHVTTPVSPKGWQMKWYSSKQVLAAAWPMGLLLLLNAVYFRIDTVILSLFRSPQEVGWYSAAYRIIESALFFPAMFGGLLLPRLSEAAAGKDKKLLRQYLSEGLTLQLVIIGFVAITMWTQAEKIILLIADASFMPAAPLLRWLVPALIAMFFGNIFGFTMIALQKQRALLKLYAVLAVATVAGTLMTIPHWGAMAAAVTTIIIEIVAMGVTAWIIYRAIAYHIPARNFLGTALATAAAGAVYVTASPNWPFLVPVGLAGVVYIATLAALGLVRTDSLSLLTKSPKTA